MIETTCSGAFEIQDFVMQIRVDCSASKYGEENQLLCFWNTVWS